jgi:hypothetical protein
VRKNTRTLGALSSSLRAYIPYKQVFGRRGNIL